MSIYTKTFGDNGARIVFGPRMKHPVFVYGKCRYVFRDIPGDLKGLTVYKAGYDDGSCYVVIAQDTAFHVFVDPCDKNGDCFRVCRLPGSYDEPMIQDFTAIGSEGCPFPEVE